MTLKKPNPELFGSFSDFLTQPLTFEGGTKTPWHNKQEQTQ